MAPARRRLVSYHNGRVVSSQPAVSLITHATKRGKVLLACTGPWLRPRAPMVTHDAFQTVATFSRVTSALAADCDIVHHRHRRGYCPTPRVGILLWGDLNTKMTPDTHCALSTASGQPVPTAALASCYGCPSASMSITLRLAESSVP